MSAENGKRILHKPRKRPAAACGLCGGAVPLTDEYEDRRVVDSDGGIHHLACWEKAEVKPDAN